MTDMFGGPENDDMEEDEGAVEAKKEVVPPHRPIPLPVPALPSVSGFGQGSALRTPTSENGPMNIPVPLMIALGLGGIGLLAWFLMNHPSSSAEGMGSEDEEDFEDEDEGEDEGYDDDDDELDEDDESDEPDEDEEEDEEGDRDAEEDDDDLDGDEEFSDDPEEGEDEGED